MNLRTYIDTKHKSAADFARMAEISPSAVSLLLSGKRRLGPRLMRKIDKATKGKVTWRDFPDDLTEAAE